MTSRSGQGLPFSSGVALLR